MEMLCAAAAFFLGIHLFVAGTTLRDALVRTLGEGAFQGLFSLASVAGIVWLAHSYNLASAAGSDQLWDLGPGVQHSGLLVIGLAFTFVVLGLLTPNPTSVGMAGLATKPDTVKGMLRITRHPFLWGVAIWSAFHLAANGDAASVVFFGTFFVLAVLGPMSIDAKRSRRMGADWEAFARQTSNVPFLAILTGRNRLAVGELLTWRLAVALLAFAAVLLGHAHLFGVSPFPGGWVPF